MSFNIEKINRNINDLDNGVVDPNQSYQAQAQEFTELISSLKNECQISFQTNSKTNKEDFMTNFDYKAKP